MCGVKAHFTAMDDLRERLAALAIALVDTMPDGASCTRLFQARGANGEALVVKVLRQDKARIDERVDGHDVATFRRKRRQIEWLRERYPDVGRLYVPILWQLDGPQWTAQVMPRVPGSHLLESPPDAAPLIGRVLERLAETGYRHQEACDGAGYVRSAHLLRIQRRLRFLAPPLIPEDALSGKGFEVNGMTCPPLSQLLAEVEERIDRLAPRRLGPPVHGDLNTRNVIAHGDGFWLVDPRGTLEPVDICYDLGKVLLSVSLWESALHPPPQAAGGYPALLAELPGTFETAPALSAALRRSGGWEMRLAFSHAMHAIAEAACRVSDARAKGLPAHEAMPAARAFFALGVVLLTDLIRRDFDRRDFDLRAHLALTHQLGRVGYKENALCHTDSP